MPIKIVYNEPVEYTSNLEGSLNFPEFDYGSDYQLSPELTSSPSLENRIQPGTTPSIGYPDRYPKVDMPASELLKQNVNVSNPTKDFSLASYLGDVTGFTQHNIDNQLLKNALDAGRITENQYKRMGGYNVSQTMPQNLGLGYGDVGAASLGYQGVKNVVGLLDKFTPFEDTMGMSKYGDIGAWESAYLNTLGAKEGLGPYDLQAYGNILGHHKPVGGMYPGGRHELVAPRTRFKQRQLMNQRKQDMQQRIRQGEAAEAAKQKAAAQAEQNRQASLQAQVTAQANREARRRVSRGEARDYGKTETRASSGWESSPFAKGGLADLYRYGGFSG